MERDLAAWRQSDNAHQGLRGVLVDLARAMRVIDYPLATRTPLEDSAQSWRNDLQAATQPSPSDIINEDVAPGSRENLRDFWKDDLFRVCFGACGQKHEVHRHSVLVRCLHDESGQVVTWTLLAGSGDKGFDANVIFALAALKSKRLSAFAGEPVPEWSQWSISEVAYRWGVAERLLDPLFRPPGKRDPRAAGTTTIVHETNLVAVKYRLTPTVH